MHFSKSYAQTLLSLPPELRENAISYRQLKKLINQVVQELTFLGFSPEFIRDTAKQWNDDLHTMKKPDTDEQTMVIIPSNAFANRGLRLLYEVDNDLGHLAPRLRLIIDKDTDMDTAVTPSSHPSILGGFSNQSVSGRDLPVALHQIHIPNSPAREYIIPLASNTAFFDLLTSAINSLSTRLIAVRSEFMAELEGLSKSISDSALPISQINASYRPFSVKDDPGAIDIPSTKSAFRPKLDARSDLYLWRQLLGLYIDSEVFDGVAERNRGERSLEDAEFRMVEFLGRVEKSGILRGKSKKAHLEVETFLRLNNIILDLKKLNYASSEASRKILKKHAKRTALPFPPSLPREIISAVGVVGMEMPIGTGSLSTGQTTQALIPLPQHYESLPQLLVQAIGETILPIIPHVDDYSCVICTGIAFKPIRLSCGHLFCVRCLVKMQKRGKSDCPMCRSPCVLTADRSNVDWALLNFMADWFPVESREKLRSNEREANAELAQELGFDKSGCLVM
ncbi:hypothetical protein BDM02DRAFT_3089024 [Thelephora ganbajun]|uniref:Uncharacterized protein n=1 Tax=Thelephora ganbajun TaxID=370292 RepID=A0ACB6ZSA3_THEGA|nr:hypothetical protein BDM02DRAFT_3089024 [Thelephora ganbajun]